MMTTCAQRFQCLGVARSSQRAGYGFAGHLIGIDPTIDPGTSAKGHGLIVTAFFHGRLQLQAIRTMPPEDVKFAPIPGVALSQTMLYRQSMEVAVAGSFLEVLTWLRSIEALPRKLLWDGLTLKTNDRGLVILTLQVHTFSPDRDALEISP